MPFGRMGPHGHHHHHWKMMERLHPGFHHFGMHGHYHHKHMSHHHMHMPHHHRHHGPPAFHRLGRCHMRRHHHDIPFGWGRFCGAHMEFPQVTASPAQAPTRAPVPSAPAEQSENEGCRLRKKHGFGERGPCGWGRCCAVRSEVPQTQAASNQPQAEAPEAPVPSTSSDKEDNERFGHRRGKGFGRRRRDGCGRCCEVAQGQAGQSQAAAPSTSADKGEGEGCHFRRRHNFGKRGPGGLKMRRFHHRRLRTDSDTVIVVDIGINTDRPEATSVDATSQAVEASDDVFVQPTEDASETNQ